MNILLHGMQSGGTTFLAFLLAQIPASICVLDLYSPHVAPSLDRGQSSVKIVKTTVAVSVVDPDSIRPDETVLAAVERGVSAAELILPGDPLDHHVASFDPDLTVLLLRNPAEIIASLRRKRYGSPHPVTGSAEAKLQLYEQRVSNATPFNLICRFEEILEDPGRFEGRLAALGLELPPDAWSFRRSTDEIVDDARSRSVWCDRFYGLRWGTGNAAPYANRDRAVGHFTEQDCLDAKRLCPTLSALYDL